MRLFHYHLVTSRVRDVEARYIGKLGFKLVARHGRSWDELDRLGFKLRLSELERGAVNVVVQPGQWEVPRLDHLGLVLDEDVFLETLERATEHNLRIQEHGGRRTFVATNAGFRLELHPPRDWIQDLLSHDDELRIGELHLRADDPDHKAAAMAEVLAVQADGPSITLDETAVRFVPGGPQGRPELHAELFL